MGDAFPDLNKLVRVARAVCIGMALPLTIVVWARFGWGVDPDGAL